MSMRASGDISFLVQSLNVWSGSALTDHGQGLVSAKNHERWGFATKMLSVIAEPSYMFMADLLRCPLLETEGQSIADGHNDVAKID